MSAQTRERWELLTRRGLVTGPAPVEAEEEGLPIQIMMGFSAWIATLCMMSGASCCVFSVMADVFEHGGSVVPGVMLMGLSWAMYYWARGASFDPSTRWMVQFVRQLALSWSMTAQGLFLFGIAMAFKLSTPESAAMLLGGVALCMQLGLIALIPDTAHRTWSALWGVSALSAFLWGVGAQGFTTPLVLGAWIYLYWAEPRPLSRYSSHMVPVRRGLLLGLVIPLVWGVVLRMDVSSHADVSRWVGEGAAVLLGLVVLWRWQPPAGAKPAWVMVAAVLLAPRAVFAPGLTASLMMLVVGFARRERGAMILGLMALLCSLSSYYYLLALTLRTKSLILIGLGLVLMGAWRWMARGAEVEDA